MSTQRTARRLAAIEQPRLSPIERWQAALVSGSDRALAELRAAYQENWPTQGELIFTGTCEFACQHCIYAPSFAKQNRGLSTAEWEQVLGNIAHGLRINTFVYGGRAVTEAGLEVLTSLRRQLPNAHIGLIDNGISLKGVRERIADVGADWIDISLDGQEAEHDLQRGRKGSYRAGLEGALWLVENHLAPKVNVLSCLTTINRHSIIPMIRELNSLGFKNFFITPVTVVDGLRPSPDLQLSDKEFASFIEEVRLALSLLNDAWVELNVFSASYAQAIARLSPEIWRGFSPERDGLAWHESTVGVAGTEFFVRYYPISLTGTRELIVNTNGDVIVPKSMAQGLVTQDQVLGNLLRDDAREIVERLPVSQNFEFYLQELRYETELLRRYF